MKVDPAGIVARTCEAAEKMYRGSLRDIRFSGVTPATFYPVVVTFGCDGVDLCKEFGSLADLEQAARAACPGNR